MSAEPLHVANDADPKRALIAEALSELRHADEIDERECEVEGWAAWYDDVINFAGTYGFYFTDNFTEVPWISCE